MQLLCRIDCGGQGKEDIALIWVKGDGGRRKVWSGVIGQPDSPCDWMEYKQEEKAIQFKDSSMGRMAGNQEFFLGLVLFGIP